MTIDEKLSRVRQISLAMGGSLEALTIELSGAGWTGPRIVEPQPTLEALATAMLEKAEERLRDETRGARDHLSKLTALADHEATAA